MPISDIAEAVILAAGEGTRLRPLTLTRPKVLIPIMNRPFLRYQLDQLENLGIDKAVIIVGYMSQEIGDWLDGLRGLDMDIETRLQREARGTADAIRSAKGAVDGMFLVLNGDVLIDNQSLGKMLGSDTVSVAAKKVPNPRDYGIFELQGDYVTRVMEKPPDPPSNMANVGTYIFDRDIFDRIENTPPNRIRNEIEITDTLQDLIDSGDMVRCYEVEEWVELGKPWDILDLNEKFLRKNRGNIDPSARVLGTLEGKVSVGKGTLVGKEVELQGPCAIGEGCRIEGPSRIGPFTSIADGVIISGSKVQGSVIMDECEIQSSCDLLCCILGSGCLVKPNAHLMGENDSEKEIRMRIKGEWRNSGRERMGPVVGDESIIGEGAKIAPGSLIQPRSRVEDREKR